MLSSRLTIDTNVPHTRGPYSGKSSARDRSAVSASPRSRVLGASVARLRTLSNASSSSSLSIVSPAASSTNASSSSLLMPESMYSSPVESHTSVSSPSSPSLDETVRLGTEYVLAMHDFSPQQDSATCLSFRAGQVIHVLNRDASGWWDGELDGRRGWFPSNYVNSDVHSLTEEEPPDSFSPRRLGHTSSASLASWASTPSPQEDTFAAASLRPSIHGTLESNTDSYCPPLMTPLLHSLSLLQSAVRANRISHFQPSTACIISCVRTVLSATDCLPRDSPILQRFSALSLERKRILTVLASLVAQAKKASEDREDEGTREADIETMLRLGGQVFAHVRRFLAVAVQCGVEITERRQSVSSIGGSTDTEQSHRGEALDATPIGKMLVQNADRGIPRSPTGALRAKSMGDLKYRRKPSSDENVPLLPQRSLSSAKSKKELYIPKERVIRNRHHAHMMSVSSTSSSSSFSSLESSDQPSRIAFPQGPSSTAQVMEALRHTHDQYLSTIAAFIGHAHSHSRSSHASSTGHMYDLVREIVEMVCNLLTIVEAVMRHPDVPAHKIGSLKSAKEGLYNVTSLLAESVRLLTIAQPPTMTEDQEKQTLLRSATGALKAGADCVAAVKMCLNRSVGERPFVIYLPGDGEPGPAPFTPSRFSRHQVGKASSLSNLQGYQPGMDEEDMTIQAQTPSPIRIREVSSGSDSSETSKISSDASKLSSSKSDDTSMSSPDELKSLPPLEIPITAEPDAPSPTDDGTTWEGSMRGHSGRLLEEKIYNGDLPSVPLEPIPEFIQDPVAWMLSHDYALDDVAYNSEGHLVGATIGVLVEKMTPHDSIVDPAFSAVFFLTFRLFSSPLELVDTVIARYNLAPPAGLAMEDEHVWRQRKGIPIRLRVSNFIKLWVEMYWRPTVDEPALLPLTTFTRDGLAVMFPGPAQRILDLLEMRRQTNDISISLKGDRIRDPGMSINPPTAVLLTSEIPRPTMTKTLLAALRSKNFTSISITDFDALELARQLTIMECNLYCAIQPEEILETGQEGAKVPVNVRAVSSLSTVITGWVAESILNEHDIKKRTVLIKFFIKVADRCTSLHNYSTPRSMLAALDSSTISRLHQTWAGVPQKNKSQLESLRRLADHSRNYHEYRSKLRNTAPPAVPFLGLYLTDVTFCREGNPSHRASPMNPDKKLLNFNKYHKLARIVQDMQRFQVPYQLKAIPEVQEYLNVAFDSSKHHGDLQDLYRRSLLVEPKQPADTPPTSDVRQLFSWASRSQSQQQQQQQRSTPSPTT